MKSAYELAMERLKVSDPSETIQLTDDQKEELADIDNKYKAKIAAQRDLLRSKDKPSPNRAGIFQRWLLCGKN